MRNRSHVVLFGTATLVGVVVGCDRSEPSRYEVLYRMGSPSAASPGGAAGAGMPVGSGGAGGTGAVDGSVATGGTLATGGRTGHISMSCDCPDLTPLTPCCTPTGRCGYVTGAFCFPLFEDAGFGTGTGGVPAGDAVRATGGSPDARAETGGRDAGPDAPSASTGGVGSSDSGSTDSGRAD